MECVVCRSVLSGRQTRFCGRACKNRFTNYHHQSYVRQRERGLGRKLRLIAMMGGRCERCGYDRNFAALEFHHLDPASKLIGLDLRSLANLDLRAILQEARKCVLLCSNCHAERHHPELDRTTWGAVWK